MCPYVICLTFLVRRDCLPRGSLLLWEIWTESVCHPCLISTFIISPVQNVFHVKYLTNMHKIGQLLKCHFTVVPKPHFLLHSVMLHRYQYQDLSLSTMQGKGVGLFVLNYSSAGSMNRYGYPLYVTVSCAGMKTLLARTFKDKVGNALNAQWSRLQRRLLKQMKMPTVLYCHEKPYFHMREVKNMGIWRKKWPIPTSCGGKKILFSAAYVNCAAKYFIINLVFLSSKAVVLLCSLMPSAEPMTFCSATVKCGRWRLSRL